MRRRTATLLSLGVSLSGTRRQESREYDEAKDVGSRDLGDPQSARDPRLHVEGNHELHQVAVRRRLGC